MNKARDHEESLTIINEMEAILEGKDSFTKKKPRQIIAKQDPGRMLVDLLRRNIRNLGDLGPIPIDAKPKEKKLEISKPFEAMQEFAKQDNSVSAAKKKKKRPLRKSAIFIDKTPEHLEPVSESTSKHPESKKKPFRLSVISHEEDAPDEFGLTHEIAQEILIRHATEIETPEPDFSAEIETIAPEAEPLMEIKEEFVQEHIEEPAPVEIEVEKPEPVEISEPIDIFTNPVHTRKLKNIKKTKKQKQFKAKPKKIISKPKQNKQVILKKKLSGKARLALLLMKAKKK